LIRDMKAGTDIAWGLLSVLITEKKRSQGLFVENCMKSDHSQG